MESISSYLNDQRLEVNKSNSKRAYLLSQFLEVINQEREGTKYKPLTPKLLGIKLAHLSTSDLFWFYSTCYDYKKRQGSFSKCFFGSLK